MTEGEYSRTLVEGMLSGGLFSIFIHMLALGIAAYVSVAAFLACRKGGPLHAGRLAYLLFLPLVFASLAIYLGVFHIPTLDGQTHTIWEMARMQSSGGRFESEAENLAFRSEIIANEVARVRLYFYAGWL